MCAQHPKIRVTVKAEAAGRYFARHWVLPGADDWRDCGEWVYFHASQARRRRLRTTARTAVGRSSTCRPRTWRLSRRCVANFSPPAVAGAFLA
jgi:hypothetical protein